MLKKNLDNKEFSRRKLLKGGAVLGATAGLAAIGGGKVTEDVVQAFGQKELDEFPIELSPDFKRFDEKNQVFSRTQWDPEMIKLGAQQDDFRNFESGPGYTQKIKLFKMVHGQYPLVLAMVMINHFTNGKDLFLIEKLNLIVKKLHQKQLKKLQNFMALI